jgi:hypothetical protein
MDTDKELFMTKNKLASIYRDNAKLHNTISQFYRTFAKKKPSEKGVALIAKHNSAAKRALAAADTITREAVLQQKYGTTVSDRASLISYKLFLSAD